MINSFRGQYGWLSNMYSIEIFYKRLRFPSSENAYMWEKCPDCQVQIKETDKEKGLFEINSFVSWSSYCFLMPPDAVKRKSKELTVREDWDKVKLKIMYDILVIKFSNPVLRKKLTATGTENIQEGNSWNDNFWGVDLKKNPNEGENWLGRIIMDIRNKIQKNKL